MPKNMRFARYIMTQDMGDNKSNEKLAMQTASEAQESAQEKSKHLKDLDEYLHKYSKEPNKVKEKESWEKWNNWQKEKAELSGKLNEWLKKGDKESMRRAGVTQKEDDQDYTKRSRLLASAYVSWNESGVRLSGIVDFKNNQMAEYKVGLGDLLPPNVKTVNVQKKSGETINCTRMRNPQTGRIGYYETLALAKGKYLYVAIHTGDKFQIEQTIDPSHPRAKRAILSENIAVYSQNSMNSNDGEELFYSDRSEPLVGTPVARKKEAITKTKTQSTERRAQMRQILGAPARLSQAVNFGAGQIEINGKRYQKLTRNFLESNIGTTPEQTSRWLVETTFLGQSLKVSPLALPYLKEAEARIKAAGIDFKLKSKAGGAQCYNHRGIRRPDGSTTGTLSLHSYAIAFDINPADHPFGVKYNQIQSKEKIPMEMVKIMQECGFRWGNDFRNADPMHFELAVNPFTSQEILKSKEGKKAFATLEDFSGNLGEKTRTVNAPIKEIPSKVSVEKKSGSEKLASAIERKTGRWLPLIKEKCEKYGISQYSRLIQAIMFQESGGNPKARGRNSNGSIDQGLMQLNNKFFKDPNIMDPAVNLDYAIKNIKRLISRYGGNIIDIASGYNCGHAEGEVIGKKTLGIPTSTKNHYVPGIIKYMDALGWQDIPSKGNYGNTNYA